MSEQTGDREEQGGTWEPLPDEGIEHYSEILKALANPARLRIVNLLTTGERTVSELCEHLFLTVDGRRLCFSRNKIESEECS